MAGLTSGVSTPSSVRDKGEGALRLLATSARAAAGDAGVRATAAEVGRKGDGDGCALDPGTLASVDGVRGLEGLEAGASRDNRESVAAPHGDPDGEARRVCGEGDAGAATELTDLAGDLLPYSRALASSVT
jgi:hypothetical protein